MDPHVGLPVDTAQPIMIPVIAAPEEPEITPAPDSVPAPRKKQQRQDRRKKPVAPPPPPPKKTLLLDEMVDTLIEELCTATEPHDPNVEDTKLGDELPALNAPAVDHLRVNLIATLNASPCASSKCSSKWTLTGGERTPATSLDDRPARITTTPADPDLTSRPHPSEESLRESPPNPPVDADAQAGVFSLDDPSTVTTIQRLAIQHGRVAHMGILDRSYRFFVNKSRTAALSFKLQKELSFRLQKDSEVAVVGGDPLCEIDMVPGLLAEFKIYRQKHRWGIAFMGASESFARSFAQPRGWTTIRFGTERVLNPQTNEVLFDIKKSSRIVKRNRQLLRDGVTLGVYVPVVHGPNNQLQSELIAVYDDWRAERNKTAAPQAFITIYDPFAIPDLMIFVYTRGSDGKVNGLAGLRRLGNGGYHVDPYIASPSSPKGITDLLVVAAMAVLQRASISYLGFGVEPSDALSREDITGMSGSLASLTRAAYDCAFKHLPIQGKKAYHKKFRPDAAQDSGLFLIFPSCLPLRLMGVLHVANISVRKILMAELRSLAAKSKTKCSSDSAAVV